MRGPIRILTAVLLGCAWFACGSAPPPNPEPPAPPDADDPAFHTRIPTWSLVGDAATPAQTDLAILVDAWPDGVDHVDAWVGALPPIRLTEDADGNRSGHVDVSSLPLGEYDVLLAANGSRTAFANATLHRSAA